MYKVLVADPSTDFGLFLVHALNSVGVEARSAHDFESALHAFNTWNPNLVISEVELSPGSGFELLDLVYRMEPRCHRMLLTTVMVDEVIPFLHKTGIANIYTKGIPFHSGEFLLRVQQLLKQDIFGLSPHLRADARQHVWKLHCPAEIDAVAEELSESLDLGIPKHQLRTALTEVLTNAMFYGARLEKDGANKFEWERDFMLPEDSAITLCYGEDSDKIGFSIQDPGGLLQTATVLYWLNRQTSKNEDGLPQGIFDTHGRGLFITRQLMDRMIINVERGKRSECVLLRYRDRPPNPHKPISVAEID